MCLGVERGDSLWRLAMLGVSCKALMALWRSSYRVETLEGLLSLQWCQVHAVRGMTERDHQRIYDSLLGYERMALVLAAIDAGIRRQASVWELSDLGLGFRTIQRFETSDLGIHTIERLHELTPPELLGIKHLGDKQLDYAYESLGKYPELPAEARKRAKDTHKDVRAMNHDLCPERANLWELQDRRARRHAAVQGAKEASRLVHVPGTGDGRS